MEQREFDKIIMLKKTGRFRDAELAYKRAIQTGDFDSRIFSALGKIFFLQDDYQKAINSYMIFFTIMERNGYRVSDCHNEIFHVFMSMIRNTSLVGYMEQNGVDSGDIIWRLRNADSVCAYKNAILGFGLNRIENGINYGSAGAALMSTSIDSRNYETSRNRFDSYNPSEKIFTISSINNSISQYKGIPIDYLSDQLL